MRQKILISLVMALRNEKGTPEPLLREFEILRDYDLELIFVEGGSIDGTYEELLRVQKLSWSYPVVVLKQDGTGKKDAVVKGLKNANGEIVLVYDADGEIGVNELPKFFDKLIADPNVFVNGNRLKLQMEKKMSPVNRFGNALFSVCMSILTRSRLADPLCGIKGARAAHYKNMLSMGLFDNSLDRFAEFDQLFGAHRLGLRIEEIPVVYHNRRYGETKVRRFTVGWQLLRRIGLELIQFPPHRTALFLSIIFIAALGARLMHLTYPFFDHASVRSIETFVIAKNFVTQHLSIWHPRVDWGGPNGGYVKFEFQAYTWMLAGLFKLFGIHAVIGRLFTIFISLASSWFVWKILRRFWSVNAALFGTMVYALNPIIVYFGRAIQPDTLMMFAVIFGVWCVAKEKPSFFWKISGILSMILAVLLKPTAGVFLAAFLPLFFNIRSWRELLRRIASKEVMFHLIVILAIAFPAFLYYRYIDRIGDMSILNSRLWWISWGTFKQFFTVHLFQIYVLAAGLFFNPIGWLLLAWGILTKYGEKDFFVQSTAWGVALFGIAMYPQWLQGFHEWHFMPVVFAMALLGAKAYDVIKSNGKRVALVLSYLAFLPPAIYILFFVSNTNPQEIAHNVALIDRYVPQDAVFAVTNFESTLTIYSTHRIGVYLGAPVSAATIEEVKGRGASYLLVTYPLAQDEKNALAGADKLVEEENDILYKL